MTRISNENILNANIKPSSQRSYVFVGKNVKTGFADNAIKQYERLMQISGCQKAKKLVILSDPNEIDALDDEFKHLSKCLKEDAAIAYGVYSKKDDAICLIQNNHERKNVDYEGDILEQASDTLTHEFAHLIDEKYSKSRVFCEAYLSDLEEF